MAFRRRKLDAALSHSTKKQALLRILPMSSKRGKRQKISPIEKRLELLETQHDILRKSNQELQRRLDQAMKWIHNEGWHLGARFHGCVGQKSLGGCLITFDLRKISRLTPVNPFNTVPNVLLTYICSFLLWEDCDALWWALDPGYMSIPLTWIDQRVHEYHGEPYTRNQKIVVKNTVSGFRGEIRRWSYRKQSWYIWTFVDFPLSWQRVLHV